MLPRTKSIFTLGVHQGSINEPSKVATSFKHPPAIGLRLLIQAATSTELFKVTNPVFRLTKPADLIYQTPSCISDQDDDRYYYYYCYPSFLKACYLCYKKLSLQDDVYMYRGDQGFCSVQCRCYQIHIDEMNEMEASTKEMLASYRIGPTVSGCDPFPSSSSSCHRRGIPAAA